MNVNGNGKRYLDVGHFPVQPEENSELYFGSRRYVLSIMSREVDSPKTVYSVITIFLKYSGIF